MNGFEKKIIFFYSDRNDARAKKLIRAFIEDKFTVVGVCYRRKKFKSCIPLWDNIDLGLIGDRQYMKRLVVMLKSLYIIIKNRDKIRNAKANFASGLDLLVLALFAKFFINHKSKVIYDVCDIRRVFVEKNLRGIIFRFIERLLLKYIHILVVTSPAFMKNYFWPIQKYKKMWFLLENKLYEPFINYPLIGQKKKMYFLDKWIVGYFGAIRCSKSWEIIKYIAKKMPDKIEFYIRGVPTKVDKKEFFRDIKTIPNIKYDGEYQNPDDLPTMYEMIHFMWCFELVDVKHNSRWLLPNRFYEGGFFGTPLLSAKGFEVGNYIEKMNLGWTFEEPYKDNLMTFFQNLRVDEYIKKRKACQKVDKKHFASKDQFHSLCNLIT